MDPILRTNMLIAAETYSRATGTNLTKIAKSVMADGSFFVRLREAETSFRVRTYDQLMGHLSYIWPTDLPWPIGIPRPEPQVAVPTQKPRRIKAEEAASDGEEAQAN